MEEEEEDDDEDEDEEEEELFAKTTSKHANTRQNTHVSCGTSRQCAASSWASVCRLLVGSHKSPVWAIEVANSVIGRDGWAAGNKQKCSTSTEAHCTHACAHTHHPTSKTKAQARLS